MIGAGKAGPAPEEEPAKKKPHFSSVMDKLRRKRQLKAPSAIERLPRDGRELPLASNQQRLWFIQQLHPETGAYNIGLTVELRGDLDRTALREAFQQVMKRHESLRTTFGQRHGEPFQEIIAELDASMPLIDLSGVALRQDQLDDLIIGIRACPFDLCQVPLLRTVLLRRSASVHILIVSQHHIVGDGWSVSILIRETMAFYRALLGGDPPQLPPLPIQYADYAAWQRKTLDEAALAAPLEFWRRHLEGSPPVLELPGDRPRPAVKSYQGALQPLRFPFRMAADLRRLARASETTLYVVLMAVFQSLILRFTGQRDFVIGTPIANRDRVELQHLIGFFANTLALRVGPRGRGRFTDLLKDLQELMLEAHRHQAMPFERLVEELQPERTLSYTPLFQIIFTFRNIPLPEFELPNLALKQIVIGSGRANFDLSLNLEEEPDRLTGYFVYSKDLFDPATIVRLGRSLGGVLEAVSSDPSQRLAELPLISSTEHHQILLEWNDTAAAERGEEHLVRLFEQQAERTPHAVAVVCGAEVLSYGALGSLTAELALELRRLGVCPGRLVGIAVERGLNLIVALLGVLKAGGAYVPLDVEYPSQRLARMLNGVCLLVTGERWVAKMTAAAQGASPRKGALPVVTLDGVTLDGVTLDGELGRPARPGRTLLATEPAWQGTLDHLIYVLYTSGSTGVPKGAGVVQRGFVNLLAWFLREFEIGSRDRLLLVSSFSFDLTQRNLYATLLVGGELHLPPPGPFDPLRLVGAIERQRITLLNATPSAFYPLMESAGESGGFSALGPLRQVFLGGEPMAPARLAPWLAATTCRTQVVNTYGPTECTAIAAFHRLDPARAPEEAAVPIGRPITRASLLVLDRFLERCPIGVPGELYIAGAGVGMGYLAASALTAARFVPHPWAGRDGQRLYRTGDLVRSRPDGELVFLGRVDNQVKVRGFRIELEEIEAVLARHLRVRAVAVATQGDKPADRMLVAYVVPDSERLAEAGEVGAETAEPNGGEWTRLVADLKQDLGKELPSYMVPTAFVALEKLPLTPNGKVDRRALPMVEAGLLGQPSPRGAPRTPQEELIAGIWAEVLGRSEVGVEDSFFDLGGHSLLATQVVSRLRALFHVEVALTRFFAAPTVAALAAEVQAQRSKAQAEAPITAAPHGLETAPLSFAQERLWFLDQLVPQSSAYNVASLWHFRGELDSDALERALREVVRRHQVLRTVFPSVDGKPRPVLLPAESWSLPAVDLGRLGPAALGEVRRCSAVEVERPFSLARGPILRSLLWRLAASEHVLLLTMHHIASDGWSTGILMREVKVLYAAFRRGASSPLAELAVQYGDFARWQRDWLEGPKLERQMAFWRQQLSGAPEVLELPLDKPRPIAQTYRGRAVELRVPAALSAGLTAASRRHQATLYMTLLGAFAALLGRFAGQDDVVVGSPVAGRTRPEIEDLVGCFINTLPLRIQLGGRAASFTELLARVREVALGAYSHQDLPFEKLVTELAPRRHLSHAPLCQVMLALQNTPSEESRLPGVAVAPLEFESPTARFELSLGLREVEGELIGSLRYNTDLFEATTARRLARHFLRLLEAMVAEEHRPWRQLPLMSAAEVHQLLIEWNPTGPPAAAPRALHHLFAERVRHQADAAALRHGDRTWSYGELDRRSSQLAAHLSSSGLAPESRVGLLLPVSPAFVIGMLGTLKAGGVFVPLEPSHPERRLRFLVRDAGIDWILCDEASPRLPPELADKQMHLDHLPEIHDPGEHDGLHPEGLAYVIYTSGSTGQPKGVMVEHRSLVNYLRWVNETWLDEVAARLPATTRPSFDAALKQLLAPLVNGSEVWIPSVEAAAEPAAFLREIRHLEEVILNGAPAFWRLLLEQIELGAEDQAAGLRRLLLGGEALSRELVERTHRALPGLEIWNLYGPTEATANATAARVDAGRPVTLGRPIANARAFVLDLEQQPVAQGYLGELCLAGPGLARGYLGRASLTAARFLPCALAARAGERLYRTGDLVRCLPTGELEFRGRIDQQVKVRGQRIEPGEIESALVQHESVSAAVVVAHCPDERPDEPSLVAYLVGDPEVPAQELRHHLRQSLPEYMIPAAQVWLETLPLTATGKIDRRALEKPERQLRGSLEMPRDEVELRLVQIWQKLLGTRPIGVDEDFFELGGHSILAVRLTAAIERAFGVELALSSLFAASTIRRLAAVLRQSDEVVTASPLVELRRGGSGRPFFCVHPVGGNVFCYLDLVHHLSPELPFYALQCVASDRANPPSLEAMAGEYLEAVRQVQPAGPYALGGWSMGGVVAFEMARQLAAAGEEVALLAMIDATAPRRGSSASENLDEATLLRRFAGDLARLSSAEQLAPQALAAFDPEKDGDRLFERIQRELGLGEGVDEARIRELYAVFCRNLKLLSGYVPGIYGGSVDYFRSSGAANAVEGAATRGWRRYVRGDVNVHRIPGDHYTILRESHVETLAEQLEACLANVEDGRSDARTAANDDRDARS